MKIEGVIFDWAGTTVDYGCFAPVQAFIEVFREFGIDVTMEETRKPMGMLKRDHIKTMLSMPRIHEIWKQVHHREVQEADIDAMHDIFTNKLMNVLEQFAEPKPYVVETIAQLRKMGLAIGSTTGYTNQMMAIVTTIVRKKGYYPDVWITPNHVDNYGRPYPYMIFENMRQLQLDDVHKVMKVGDTISDIQEGKAAGVISIGILEGSSLMGVTQAEYEAYTPQEQKEICDKITTEYMQAGADGVITNLRDLPSLIASWYQDEEKGCI